MDAIQWKTNFAMTEDAAITEYKGILVNFHDPDSIACRKMEKETFSRPEIIHFIDEHVEPYRAKIGEEPYFFDYNITWTPAVIFLDKTGKEHHRSVGYLGPDEFMATILLALGKIYANNNNYSGGTAHFDRVLKRYPGSPLSAEAVYYRGVNRYKETGDAQKLRNAAEHLREHYPASSWTLKAAPYLK